MIDQCSSNSANTTCGPPVWYNSPCNDGNGGPCPSSLIKPEQNNLPELQLKWIEHHKVKETLPTSPEILIQYLNDMNLMESDIQNN